MLNDTEINKIIIKELQKYSVALENIAKDMADINFTIENGKFYLLSVKKGHRTPLANLRIIISMFCEGKLSIGDAIKNLSYKELEEILNQTDIINTEDLKQLSSGIASYSGTSAAIACFSYSEAISLMLNKEDFIYCQTQVSKRDVLLISSTYCKGVITSQGGLTSHAATICRGLGLPCVTGFGDYDGIKAILSKYNNELTIDGNNGNLYAGIGITKKCNLEIPEIKILFELLKLIIKNNLVTPEIAPLVWRLWNVVVLDKRYRGNNNTKRHVIKADYKYKSFIQPSQDKVDQIFQTLYKIENGGMIVEDLISFLSNQISAQVLIGQHYLYMRPLLNPMDTLNSVNVSENSDDSTSVQLMGIEFFQINKYIDFLIDIYSIKIFFSIEFDNYDYNDNLINYLDFTNPNGESLVINRFDAMAVLIYINDVRIPDDSLAMVYHLIRRRAYHWSWYTNNNINYNEIKHFLKSKSYLKSPKGKLAYLCQEMQLLYDGELTAAGISLLGE